MRFGQLINDARGAGLPDEIKFTQLSALANGIPSASHYNRLGLEPTADQLGENPLVKETPWGTISTMDDPVKPRLVMGVCRAQRIPTREAWLAVGESCGLPGMFSGSRDEKVASLAAGWVDLGQPRMHALRRYSADLVDAEEAEHRLSAALERVAQLEEQVEQLTAARRPSKRAAK